MDDLYIHRPVNSNRDRAFRREVTYFRLRCIQVQASIRVVGDRFVEVAVRVCGGLLPRVHVVVFYISVRHLARCQGVDEGANARIPYFFRVRVFHGLRLPTAKGWMIIFYRRVVYAMSLANEGPRICVVVQVVFGVHTQDRGRAIFATVVSPGANRWRPLIVRVRNVLRVHAKGDLFVEDFRENVHIVVRAVVLVMYIVIGTRSYKRAVLQVGFHFGRREDMYVDLICVVRFPSMRHVLVIPKDKRGRD